MNLDKYQKEAREFDNFEISVNLTEPGFIEKVLGLVGEAGETADKVKKIIRDKGGRAEADDIDAIKKELGDILWYVANVARYLGLKMSDIAETNIEKLSSRKARHKLHGSGDER